MSVMEAIIYPRVPDTLQRVMMLPVRKTRAKPVRLKPLLPEAPEIPVKQVRMSLRKPEFPEQAEKAERSQKPEKAEPLETVRSPGSSATANSLSQAQVLCLTSQLRKIVLGLL